MKTIAYRLKEAREAAGMTQPELAKKAGVSPGTIGNIEAGTRKNPRELLAIARAAGVRAEWLRDGKGPMVDDNNVSVGPDFYGRVPLISWVQAGTWAEAIDTFQPGDAEDWLLSPKKTGPRMFALRVKGISMEPKYRDGAIIYVDPDRSPDHLKNVIVRLEENNEVTFKQLVIEGDKRFLRPLNPDWPEKLIEINGHATICGVVVGQYIED